MHVCLCTHIWHTHISHISLNKYGCHIANLSHTAIMLKWTYIHNSFAYMCYNTTICNIYFTCHYYVYDNDKYATQMLHIWYIYKLVHMQIGENCLYICASYELTAINSMTRNTGIHTFVLLSYAPEQICQPHYINMSHCTTTVVYI